MKTTVMKARLLFAILSVISVFLLPVQNSSGTPGILMVTDLNAGPGTNLQFEIDGPGGPGVGFSQIIATNSVTINNANLVLLMGFTPMPGTMFEIINNQGSGPVMGTGFLGLGEGSIFTASGDTFQITYAGGTGNDVVLTAEAPTVVPDSGSTLGLLIVSLLPLFGVNRFRARQLA